MTLSLDDVRNKRFRMARKSGYEVLEVDEFVDEVEVAFEQLTEENANLKKQIEALRATPATGGGTPAEPEAVIVTTGAEASTAVVRLVAMATEQAERLVNEATAEADKVRGDAGATAQEVTGEAQAQAERVRTEAQQAADRMTADATSRADNLAVEIAARRSELLDGLNAERDDLQRAVGQLRSFEASYRTNLADELRGHIATLEAVRAEPQDVPALADPAAVPLAEEPVADTDASQTAEESDEQPTDHPDHSDGTAGSTDGQSSVFPPDDPATETKTSNPSETPRLDALLGDQR